MEWRFRAVINFTAKAAGKKLSEAKGGNQTPESTKGKRKRDEQAKERIGGVCDLARGGWEKKAFAQNDEGNCGWVGSIRGNEGRECDGVGGSATSMWRREVQSVPYGCVRRKCGLAAHYDPLDSRRWADDKSSTEFWGRSNGERLIIDSSNISECGATIESIHLFNIKEMKNKAFDQ